MEPGNTEHYLEQLNLTELMEQLNRCFSSAFLANFSLEQLFSDILSGNGKEALQLLGRQIAGSVGQEFSGMRQILSVLLLLGILSVLVSCLMGSFENQQVAQIAHDMFFLLVLTVLLKVFSAVYRITGSTLETLKQFSHLTLPALCLSLGPAAGSVTAAGYYELTLGFIFLIERFLTGFCLLLLPLWMLLVVLSGVWEEGRLSAMMELVEKSLSNIVEVKSRGAEVIAMTTDQTAELISSQASEMFVIPKPHSLLQPVLGVIPLQLFAYYVALNRGCDIISQGIWQNRSQ